MIGTDKEKVSVFRGKCSCEKEFLQIVQERWFCLDWILYYWKTAIKRDMWEQISDIRDANSNAGHSFVLRRRLREPYERIYACGKCRELCLKLHPRRKRDGTSDYTWLERGWTVSKYVMRARCEDLEVLEYSPSLVSRVIGQGLAFSIAWVSLHVAILFGASRN